MSIFFVFFQCVQSDDRVMNMESNPSHGGIFECYVFRSTAEVRGLDMCNCETVNTSIGDSLARERSHGLVSASNCVIFQWISHTMIPDILPRERVPRMIACATA